MSTFHSFLLQFLECIHLASSLALTGIDQAKASLAQYTVHTEVIFSDGHSVEEVCITKSCTYTYYHSLFQIFPL